VKAPYYAKVLKEDVPLALDILSDILLHSSFDPANGTRTHVILQEIGQATTRRDIIFDHFQSRPFRQPMGRPVLGQPEIIRASRATRSWAICATIRRGAHVLSRPAI